VLAVSQSLLSLFLDLLLLSGVKPSVKRIPRPAPLLLDLASLTLRQKEFVAEMLS
jgi:hypothetical protein